MSNLQFTGVIKLKKETDHVSDKFCKREFVVQDDSAQYPKPIMFQLVQDNCDLLDNFNEEDLVTVSFNLDGRVWQNAKGKDVYFNSLTAWKIDKK